MHGNTRGHIPKGSFTSQRENGKLHYEPIVCLGKRSIIYTLRLSLKASDLRLCKAVDLFICG